MESKVSCKKRRSYMVNSKASNKILIRNILSKYITPDLFEINHKEGWINDLLFKGVKYDPHNASIKLGQRMELICREIAQLKYGVANVPFYICGEDISEEEVQKYFENKYPRTSYAKQKFCHILTKFNVEKMKNNLSTPLTIVKKYGKLHKDSLENIYNDYCDGIEITDSVTHVATDLIIIGDDGVIRIYEMKVTGDIDSKSASANTANMLISYLNLGDQDAELFFVVLSSNNKNKVCPSSMKKYMDDKSVLIEDDFWKIILPEGVSFIDFKSMFKRRFRRVKGEYLE